MMFPQSRLLVSLGVTYQKIGIFFSKHTAATSTSSAWCPGGVLAQSSRAGGTERNIGRLRIGHSPARAGRTRRTRRECGGLYTIVCSKSRLDKDGVVTPVHPRVDAVQDATGLFKHESPLPAETGDTCLPGGLALAVLLRFREPAKAT